MLGQVEGTEKLMAGDLLVWGVCSGVFDGGVMGGGIDILSLLG